MEKAEAIRQRLKAVRRRMRDVRLPAIYITDQISRSYLTGFNGTAGTVFITQDEAILFTDFRYTERATEEVPSSIIVTEITQRSMPKINGKINRIGIEDNSLSLASYLRLKNNLKSFQLKSIGKLIEEVRATKDETEIEQLAIAIKATDFVFINVYRWLKGRRRAKRLPTEDEVAWKVRDIIHQKNLGSLAFDTIVATGKNAARPHHEPTSQRLKKGDMVIIDLGVKVGGYHADMSRTLFMGEPDAKQRAMFTTALNAQNAALKYLNNKGKSAGQADLVARKIIDNKFPSSFGHSLGHGVGLEIHENPTLVPGSHDKLKNGMVFSIEPGIYLSGFGGVRIEDLVLLKGGKPVVLSRSPKTLKSAIF